MKIYFRHLFFRISAIFCIAMTLLIMLISLTQVLKYLHLVTQGAGLLDLIDVMIFNIPAILYIILPIGTVVSVLYFYFTLSKSNEIILLKGLGLNNFQIASPGLFFACLVTLGSYFVTINLLPSFFTHLRAKIVEISSGAMVDSFRPNSFNRITNGLNIYLGRQKEHNVFENIVIFDHRQKERFFIAKKAKIYFADNALSLHLIKGQMQIVVDNKGACDNLKFTDFNLNIALPNPLDNLAKHSEGLALSELLHSGDPKLIAQGHQRIVWPAYNFVLVFFALSKFLNQPKLSWAQLKLIFTLILIVLIYFSICSLSIEYAEFFYVQYLSPLLLVLFSWSIMIVKH